MKKAPFIPRLGAIAQPWTRCKTASRFFFFSFSIFKGNGLGLGLEGAHVLYHLPEFVRLPELEHSLSARILRRARSFICALGSSDGWSSLRWRVAFTLAARHCGCIGAPAGCKLKPCVVCSCPFPVAMSLSHDADCVDPTVVAPGVSCGGTVGVSPSGPCGVAGAAQSPAGPSGPEGYGCASCDGSVAVSLPGSDGVAAAAQSLVVPSAPSRDGIFVWTTDTFVDDFFYRDEPLQENIFIRGGKSDVFLHTAGPGESRMYDEWSLSPGPGHPRQRSKGGRIEVVTRLIHAAGRSRFLLHEKATMHDLKVKVNISTGVQGHLQRLTYDAHGENPIMFRTLYRSLRSVWAMGLCVVWLVNKICAGPQIATADSSHRSPKSLITQDQHAFATSPSFDRGHPDRCPLDQPYQSTSGTYSLGLASCFCCPPCRVIVPHLSPRYLLILLVR